MIEVITPGLMSSIQDLGRSGYGDMGISQSGAIDSVSLRLANYLLNNRANTATLEIIFSPSEFLFHNDAYIAITGTVCQIMIDDRPAPLGWRIFVKKGERLKIKPLSCGMSNYLAVQGGFNVPRVMNSFSTDIKSRYGGHSSYGQMVKKGDMLPLNENATIDYTHERIGIPLPVWDNEIRVIAGPEYHDFTPEAKKLFWNTEWVVSTSSNRMGFRLQGPILERLATADLSSLGGFSGVIQVPPNGQPIILASEAQTTGGYPRMGVIIKADLWKLGQVCLSKPLKFTEITTKEAIQALIKQNNYLKNIKYRIRERYETGND